jgi:hypothetical protein
VSGRAPAFGEGPYHIALVILALLVVWVSFMYNHGAYAPRTDSSIQSALFLAPLVCIAVRVRHAGVRHPILMLFLALAFPLVAAGGLRIQTDGWVYLLLIGLPLFWLTGLYALLSLPRGASRR